MNRTAPVTSALVLRLRDYGDRDCWVTLLTEEHGKVVVLAKGLRTLKSRRRPAVQTGNLIRCSWSTRGEMSLLTEAVYQESLLAEQPTLDRVRDFSGIVEMVFHLALENMSQPELYDGAVRLLRLVGQADQYHRGAVRQHLLALVEEQGVAVEAPSPHISVSEVVEQALDQKLRSFAFLQV